MSNTEVKHSNFPYETSFGLPKYQPYHNAITFDNYMDLKFDLEDNFQKKVDLVIIDDIKPELKQNILRDAMYAEGA